jgi:FixJ family two-component response regulator
MKGGAVDFLMKPVSGPVLLRAIKEALKADEAARVEEAAKREIRTRLASLTAREHQVFALVIKGWLNKQIAAELGISLKTVKVHRARVMEKMQVISVADLVQAAVRVEVDPTNGIVRGEKNKTAGTVSD